MEPNSPPASPAYRARWWLLAAVVCVALATVADPWAYTHLAWRGVYDQNAGRMVRSIGFLPFWIIAGIALWLSSRSRWGRHAGLLLMASPTLAGAIGQVLKLLVRRGRPLAHDGLYVFRDFTERPFYTRDFGMPSGDVVVAFAACAVLARLWPGGRPIWYALAVACALGRIFVGAHFLSDVTVAALLGWLVAAALWRRFPPPGSPESETPRS